jgi:S-adenosylmethionine synthetase
MQQKIADGGADVAENQVTKPWNGGGSVQLLGYLLTQIHMNIEKGDDGDSCRRGNHCCRNTPHIQYFETA